MLREQQDGRFWTAVSQFRASKLPFTYVFQSWHQVHAHGHPPAAIVPICFRHIELRVYRHSPTPVYCLHRHANKYMALLDEVANDHAARAQMARD
jgi:hypothetical protein